MEPEEEQQSLVVVEEPPQVAPAAEAALHAEGVFAVLLAAGLVSMLLRRISRSNAAGHLRRWLPVMQAAVWGAAVVIVTVIYARGLSGSWYLAIWLLFLMIIFSSVGWLRSVMSGVALSIEGRIRLGDSIRVGDVSGEVVGFSMRSLRLRGVDGSIHDIPNQKLVTETVANLSGDGGDSACELVMAVPEWLDPNQAVEVARRIAILTPLASPRHRPEVFLEAHGPNNAYDLRVRGYAFDTAYQDHYRSDVVSRIQAAFRRESSAPPTFRADRRIITEE